VDQEIMATAITTADRMISTLMVLVAMVTIDYRQLLPRHADALQKATSEQQ